MTGKRIILILISSLISMLCGKIMAEEVKLISTGEGSSKDLAVKNALVNAVEQAYGMFVSGDTRILDDELIRDEVVQIKRGNIKKYSILNEAKVGTINYVVIVDATVSIDNLLKFAESKGSKCELAGKSFAANLALKKMYMKNGAATMEQLYNILGYFVPKMYDYKLRTGDPFFFDNDAYIPIEIDCVLNDNYDTFQELYTTTQNHVNASIASANIQGEIERESAAKINHYRDMIMKLPEIWIFGFKLEDNIGNDVFSVLTSGEYFWPKDQVAPYRFNNRYSDNISITFTNPKTGHVLEIPKLHFITYEDVHVIESHGPRIQKLNYNPLCSESKGGTGLLKSYVKRVEDKFSKPRAMGHTGVYDIRDFDEKMIDWTDGLKQQGKYMGHKWINNPKWSVGKSVCTIYFFLCYDEADIEKLTDIKVKSIKDF